MELCFPCGVRALPFGSLVSAPDEKGSLWSKTPHTLTESCVHSLEEQSEGSWARKLLTTRYRIGITSIFEVHGRPLGYGVCLLGS